MFRHGSALGDQVCLTAIVKMVREQRGYRSIVITSRPEFFKANPNIVFCLDLGAIPARFQSYLIVVLRLIEGRNVEEFLYRGPYADHILDLCFSNRGMHLIECHSQHFRRKLSYRNARTDLHWVKNELNYLQEKIKLPEKFGLIQSTGKVAFTPNKEWGVEKFQEVIQSMPEITWLQTGLPDDALLKGVIDFRGRTTSLRELAYLVYRSHFVFGLEGLLNHLAAAFEKRSFVLFSGFLPPSLAFYPTTTPLHRNPLTDCTPCGLRTPCPVPGKPCTEDIPPGEVVKTIRQVLALEGELS